MARTSVGTRLVGIMVCLVVASTLAAAKQGKVKKGVFSSPLGDYTVAVPKFPFGGQTSQQFNDHGGSVSFHDDFGTVYRIVSDELGPEMMTKVNDVGPDALRAYLESYVVPELFRRVAPRTEIVHVESVVVGDKPACFAVLSVPEGSVLEDSKTHKRLDDRLGLLILAREKFMYMLGVGGPTNLLDPEKSPPPVDELSARYRKQVEAFYGSVTFTAPSSR